MSLKWSTETLILILVEPPWCLQERELSTWILHVQTEENITGSRVQASCLIIIKIKKIYPGLQLQMGATLKASLLEAPYKAITMKRVNTFMKLIAG